MEEMAMPTAGKVVRPTLGSGRSQADAKLYARAAPEKVEITETYGVTQEIAKSRSRGTDRKCDGLIHIEVPYDGHKYFTRQAVDDVEHALDDASAVLDHDQVATIGHLLIADHSQTDLNTGMRLHGKVGVIPVEVPVTLGNGDLTRLNADRRTCVIKYTYEPLLPEIVPAHFDISLLDPDALEIFEVKMLTKLGQANPAGLIEQLRQEATFRSELVLRLSVRLSLPVKDDYPRVTPVVKRVSIGWPTITSLSTTRLEFVKNREAWWRVPPSSTSPSVPRLSRSAAPVQYNPVDRRLEWGKVPMFKAAENHGHRDPGTRSYESAQMLLKIGHPGELYDQEMLEIHAEVEIPRYLLSGVEARLYSATGRSQQLRPKLTTKIRLSTRLWPADVFKGRTFSPYHRIIFDEVMPDAPRVTDIITVLGNRQFKVESWADPGNDHRTQRWLLTATRSQGSSTMTLLIAVDGTRRTRNIQRLPSDTRKISEHAETGRITLSVLGALPLNHQDLTREMNALHQALRNRYRYHRD
jgi:hypothetical protein